MSTLEEMVETYSAAVGGAPMYVKTGLTAVLERHVRGMLHSAHANGMVDGLTKGLGGPKYEQSEAYADRSISSLKGQKP